MNNLPNEIISHILSFIEAAGLFQCAMTCRRVNELTSNNHIWRRAARRLYPHLDAHGAVSYRDNWRDLVLDHNRDTRQKVFEWTIPDILTNTSRRRSETFTVNSYTFRIILDPAGNPAVEYDDGGEGGMSVYLSTTDSVSVNFTICVIPYMFPGQNIMFGPDRRSWGTHCLIPKNRLKQFVAPDGSISISVKITLNLLTILKYTNADMDQHYGFGLVGDATSKIVRPYTATMSEVASLGLSSMWRVHQPMYNTVLIPRDRIDAQQTDTLADVFGHDLGEFDTVRVWLSDDGHDAGDDCTIFVKWIDRFLMSIHVPARTTADTIYRRVEERLGYTDILAHIETTPSHGWTATPVPRDAVITESQIYIFYPASDPDTIERVYRRYEKVLTEKILSVLHSRTPRLWDATLLFEKYGYQDFRVVRTAYKKNHAHVSQTIRYIARGCHLFFCCDQCGVENFEGVRYKCAVCEDYDLCSSCHAKSPASHRYTYDKGKWRRQAEFTGHQSEHAMVAHRPFTLAR